MDDFAPPIADDGGEKKRNRGIMLSKFQEKCTNDDFKQTVSVMYRNPSTQALDILYQNFPREALVLFSDTFREAFISGEKMIVLPRGNDIGAIKKIFAWIKQCISEASLVDFEEYDEEAPDTIARYIKVIRAAESIQVPARDFQEKLIKRMRKIAKYQREHDRRVDWDLIEDIYTDENAVIVRSIAASTVFFSWWYAHVNSEDTPEEMEILAELRENFPQFDEDLKAEFEDQKRFLDERKKKRDEERAGEGTGEGWGGDAGVAGTGSGWEDTGAATAGVGWEDTAAAAASGSGGWDDGAAAGGGGDWNGNAATSTGEDWSGSASSAWESGKENVAQAKGDEFFGTDDFGGADSHGGGNDWADEVNNHSMSQPQW